MWNYVLLWGFAVHKLKGHCELLDAYLWHKLSADRQRQFAENLLEHFASNEAYLHFDFKENIRYPMSKEETGDEWHAQNKLSLTVFGCTVHTPGRKDMHFLLVTEVLDHDSQIAKLPQSLKAGFCKFADKIALM